MSDRGKVKIVSDGRANGTVVLDGNGEPIRWGRSGITKIEIRPIEPEGLVEAVFTVRNLALDLVAFSALTQADTGAPRGKPALRLVSDAGVAE
jgi:hypothetical protein